MAFKLSGGEDEEGGLSEINVTPFIDVMLVLLIIFMVAAPLATVNVPLDLPVSSTEAPPDESKLVVVSVQADLALFVGEQPTSEADLGSAVREALGASADQRVFLRADKGVSYGDLMKVMDMLRQAGHTKVALVTLDQSGGG